MDTAIIKALVACFWLAVTALVIRAVVVENRKRR